MINVTFYTTPGHEITLEISDDEWEEKIESVNQEIDATTDSKPFPPQESLIILDKNGNPNCLNNVYAYKINSSRPDHAAADA